MSENPTPPSTKNYITASGAESLKVELKKLLTLDRPELVKVISWAASNGDRSENGDYIYGKRRLREIDRRIRFLSKRLEASEIVDPSKLDPNKVLFGAYVTVLNEDEVEKTYRIVGQDELNPSQGWVSWVSPIAKALLNTKVGDVVQLRTPKGVEDLEVVRIRY
jgi:transcription elongation factor GreB